jgi:hypothetical protein
MIADPYPPAVFTAANRVRQTDVGIKQSFYLDILKHGRIRLQNRLTKPLKVFRAFALLFAPFQYKSACSHKMPVV